MLPLIKNKNIVERAWAEDPDSRKYQDLKNKINNNKQVMLNRI